MAANIRNEMDKGDPVLRTTKNTSYVGKALLVLLSVGICVLGIGAAIADDDAPWWIAVVGLVIGAIVLTSGMPLTQITIVIKDATMYIAAGYRTVKVPLGAIGYLGRVRLTRRNALRLSRYGNLTNAKPGPGIEVVTRDGKYFNTLVDNPDELFAVMLKEGLDPTALQRPFPSNVVRGRENYDRELRGASAPNPSPGPQQPYR